jgi:hypothetical protein
LGSAAPAAGAARTSPPHSINPGSPLHQPPHLSARSARAASRLARSLAVWAKWGAPNEITRRTVLPPAATAVPAPARPEGEPGWPTKAPSLIATFPPARHADTSRASWQPS